MLRPIPSFATLSALLLAAATGEASSAAIEIVAARARTDGVRGAALAPGSMSGLWIEVADRAGTHRQRIHLGDPLLLPYDDMGEGAVGLGLGRVEERTLFIPITLPQRNGAQRPPELDQDPPPNARFAMRLLALCCVGRTDLMLDVAPLRLRSNRLAALLETKIRTARARITWRILVDGRQDFVGCVA